MSAETSGSVSHIQDEDVLRQMWQNTADFGKKKEIRSHMYKLREERLRNFYCTNEPGNDIHKAQSTPGLNEKGLKEGNSITHADSLGDHSFLSLKSKEIRDSESPTRDVHYRVSDKNFINPSWNVQAKSETSNDGKTHSVSRIATTSGTEQIQGGAADYSALCEQTSSVFADGDDNNYTKSASATSKSVLQQTAATKDDNSETKSVSTSSSSTSKVFTQKHSTTGDTTDYQYLPITTENANSDNVIRKTYTTNVPAEFKTHPHYVDGKTKVTTETRVMPDGTKVTTTKYETRGVGVASSEQHTSTKQQKYSTTTGASKTLSENIHESRNYKTTTDSVKPKNVNDVVTLKVIKLSNENDNQDSIQKVTKTTSNITQLEQNRQISRSTDVNTSINRDDVKITKNIRDTEYVPQTNQPRGSQYPVDPRSKTNIIQTERITTETKSQDSQNLNNCSPNEQYPSNVQTPQYNTKQIVSTTTSSFVKDTAGQNQVVKHIETLERDQPIKQESLPIGTRDIHHEEISQTLRDHKSTKDFPIVQTEPPPPKYQEPEKSFPKFSTPTDATTQPETKPCTIQPEIQTSTTISVTKTRDESERPFKPDNHEKPQRLVNHEIVSEANTREMQTTYQTDYTSKRISIDNSPTHDAFARSLRAVSPDRGSFRSNSSLRRSVTPDKHPSDIKPHATKDRPSKTRQSPPNENITHSPRSSPSKQVPTNFEKQPKEFIPKRLSPEKTSKSAHSNQTTLDFYNVQISQTNARTTSTTRTSDRPLLSPSNKQVLQVTDLDEDLINVERNKAVKGPKHIFPETRPTSLNVTTVTTKKSKKITDRSPTSPLTPTKDKPHDKQLKRRDTYEERCRQILGIDKTTEIKSPSGNREPFEKPNRHTPDNENLVRPTDAISRSPTKEKQYTDIDVKSYTRTTVSSQQRTEQIKSQHVQEHISRRSQKEPTDSGSPGKPFQTKDTHNNVPQKFDRPERNDLQAPKNISPIRRGSGLQEYPSQVRHSPEKLFSRQQKTPERQSPEKRNVVQHTTLNKQTVTKHNTEDDKLVCKVKTSSEYENFHPKQTSGKLPSRQLSPVKNRQEISEFPSQIRHPQDRSPTPKQTSPIKDRLDSQYHISTIKISSTKVPVKEIFPSSQEHPTENKYVPGTCSGLKEKPNTFENSPRKQPSPEKSVRSRQTIPVKNKPDVTEHPTSNKDSPSVTSTTKRTTVTTGRVQDQSNVCRESSLSVNNDDNEVDLYVDQTTTVTYNGLPKEPPESETPKLKPTQSRNYVHENLETIDKTSIVNDSQIYNTSDYYSTPQYPDEESDGDESSKVHPSYGVPSSVADKNILNQKPYNRSTLVPEEIITITEAQNYPTQFDRKPSDSVVDTQRRPTSTENISYDFYETQTRKNIESVNSDTKEAFDSSTITRRPKGNHPHNESETTIIEDITTILRDDELTDERNQTYNLRPEARYRPSQSKHSPEKYPEQLPTQAEILKRETITQKSQEYSPPTGKTKTPTKQSEITTTKTFSKKTTYDVQHPSSLPQRSAHRPVPNNENLEPLNNFPTQTTSAKKRDSTRSPEASPSRRLPKDTFDGDLKPKVTQHAPTQPQTNRQSTDVNPAKGRSILQEYPAQSRQSPSQYPVRQVPASVTSKKEKQPSPTKYLHDTNIQICQVPKMSKYASLPKDKPTDQRTPDYKKLSQPIGKEEKILQEYPSQTGRSPSQSLVRQVPTKSVPEKNKFTSPTKSSPETTIQICPVKLIPDQEHPLNYKKLPQGNINQGLRESSPKPLQRDIPTSVVNKKGTVHPVSTITKPKDQKYPSQGEPSRKPTFPISESFPNKKQQPHFQQKTIDKPAVTLPKSTSSDISNTHNISEEDAVIQLFSQLEGTPDINEPVCTQRFISNLCREDEVQRNKHRTIKKDLPQESANTQFIDNERSDTTISLIDSQIEEDIHHTGKSIATRAWNRPVPEATDTTVKVLRQEEIIKNAYNSYPDDRNSPKEILHPYIKTNTDEIAPIEKGPITTKGVEITTKTSKSIQNKVSTKTDDSWRKTHPASSTKSTIKVYVDAPSTNRPRYDSKLNHRRNSQSPQKLEKPTRQSVTTVTTTTITQKPLRTEPKPKENSNQRAITFSPAQSRTKVEPESVVFKTRKSPSKPGVTPEKPAKECTPDRDDYITRTNTVDNNSTVTIRRINAASNTTKRQESPQKVTSDVTRTTPTRTTKPLKQTPERDMPTQSPSGAHKVNRTPYPSKTATDSPLKAIKPKIQPETINKRKVTTNIQTRKATEGKLQKTQYCNVPDTNIDTSDDESVEDKRLHQPSPCIVTTKSILINNDLNEGGDFTVTLLRSTSSREPTPDRIYPQLTSDEGDFGTPRYPDEISEPQEPSRKPFYIHEPNSGKPTYSNQTDNENRHVRVDRVDDTDESLLTVTEKVSKFVSEAEKLTKLQQVTDSNREHRVTLRPGDSNQPEEIDYYAPNDIPPRPKSPRCRNYPKEVTDQSYTSVSDRVSHFIKSAENVKTPQKTHIVETVTARQPDDKSVDNGLINDACLMSVSHKVSKFTTSQKDKDSSKPISLAKLDISPKKPQEQLFKVTPKPTNIPDCPQIKSERDTYTQVVTPRKDSLPRNLNSTTSFTQSKPSSTPEPSSRTQLHELDSTPKSSRKGEEQAHLHTTGRLRSTETIRRAKELFENNKVQNVEEPRFTKGAVKNVEKVIKRHEEDYIKQSHNVGRTTRPLDGYQDTEKTPRQCEINPNANLQNGVPESKHRTKSPEPHDLSLEGVPHYMWPLERTSRDHSIEHERSHSRSTVDTPETQSRRMSRGSTPDRHIPGYMKPLDRRVSPNLASQSKPDKFGVTLKSTNTAKVHIPAHPKVIESFDVTDLLTKSDFEDIFDIEILELLLERATTYEQRRKIRAQLRIVKQNDESSVVKATVSSYPNNKIVRKSREDLNDAIERVHKKDTVDRRTEYQSSYQTEERFSSTEKAKQRVKDVRQEKTVKTLSYEIPQNKPDKAKKISSEDGPPTWVKQRTLKKVSESPRVESTVTTKTTRKQTVSKSTATKGNEPTDVITSSYGVGPMDENGSPLFGLKALRHQNQTESKKVQGTVIQSHYYSKNGQEPVGEIRVTKYSTDPRDLQGNVEDKDKDGLVSVTTIKKIGPKETPRKRLADKKKSIDISDESYEAFGSKTTQVARRDSVKEMSKKFIENSVETSTNERQSSYPKAGLILRTSSFKDTGKNDDEKESFSDTQSSVRTVTVTKTVTSRESGDRVDTFLTNQSPVRGVQDTITRMKNAESDIQAGDSPEDVEARTLLNKFIGSQVILSGMESGSSASSGATSHKRTTTTTTTTSRGSEKPTTITRTFTHPITTEDLNTVWDEDTLKLLLERSTEYEERRVIRARLRDIMAEQEVSGSTVQQAKEDSRDRVEEVETSRTTVTEGPVTTNKVTTRVTSQQVTKKPISPFAKFQQLDKQNSLNSPGTPRTPTGSGPLFKFTDPELSRKASTVKERLLQWCQMKTKEYENVQLDNFTSSWSDGLAFCALIHHFLPDAFDYHALTPKERRYNFDLAFRIADEKANIAPLLDVDDMVATRKPDWKCVFTYVQTIYARFKNED